MQTTERDQELMVGAIDWIKQLPLLGVEELSSLLETREDSVSRTLAGLERLGWVEWLSPESPKTIARRLYFLTNGENASTETHGQDRKDILLRLARLETTMALNRFLVEMVQGASRDIQMDLIDARSLPSGVDREARWWPPEIEGYGCLREGSFRAPFFIAWDRAGAPDLHRRIRVSGWYGFGDLKTPWRGEALPPILVICPSEREIEQWAKLVIASADRRGCALLRVILANGVAAWRDPLGAIWRRVDGTRRDLLRERVRWVLRLPAEAESPQFNTRWSFAQAEQHRPPLREWVHSVLADDERRRALTETERIGALALAANADHKILLEWIGHHPLLSAPDLSTLLGLPELLVERLLKRLSEWRLVSNIIRATKDDGGPLPRFFLTGEGLRLLAARDGVPWQRYFRHGVLAAPAQGKRQRDRLKGFLNQFEHTVGVNSFFVRLAASVPTSGRLLRWLNAAESTKRCEHGGKTHLLRPDASGIVAAQGHVRHFFLEWDRGTMRGSQMREKFDYYAAYFASRRTTTDVGPAALVVTKSPHRENVIWDDLKKAFDEVNGKPSRFFTSVDSLISGPGPFAPIWRSLCSSRRGSWPEPRTRGVLDPSAEGSTTTSLTP